MLYSSLESGIIPSSKRNRRDASNIRRYGQPVKEVIVSDSTITIPLTQGQNTVIDTVDADLAQFKWYAHKTTHGYYAARTIKHGDAKQNVFLHRIILSRKLGRELMPAPQELVDHEDTDKLNNRRDNLRLAEQATNMMNTNLRSDNTSGFKGVFWHKLVQAWEAHIRTEGKKRVLGYYNTREQAAIAYNHAAIKHFGEFARLNDIPGWENIHPTPKTLNRNNKSGYTGVYWSKDHRKWCAEITINGKKQHLGYFSFAEHAAAAYKIAKANKAVQS